MKWAIWVGRVGYPSSSMADPATGPRPYSRPTSVSNVASGRQAKRNGV